MERKIGEIFEYNGGWYQCVECDSCGNCSLRATECGSGTKSDLADEVFGQCSKVSRSDNKHAIFKKLEKVGEPTMLDGKLVQKILTTDRYSCNGCCFESPECDKADNDLCCVHEIYVEIKQNKEDMEENNNAKHSNSENIGKNLKPFDLQAAKSGKPVCTREGRKARIICFDRKDIKPIVALVTSINGDNINEKAFYYFEDGHHLSKYDNNINDLMMLPEKKEGWVNVSKFSTYASKEEALSHKTYDIIDTIKVSWEE